MKSTDFSNLYSRNSNSISIWVVIWATILISNWAGSELILDQNVIKLEFRMYVDEIYPNEVM